MDGWMDGLMLINACLKGVGRDEINGMRGIENGL